MPAGRHHRSGGLCGRIERALIAIRQQGHNAAAACFSVNGDKMSDQPAADVPSGTARAWDSVRRVREPVAWALLVLAAVIVLVSAGQLFNLPGARIPVVGGPAPSAFALRASAVAPQFVGAFVIALPVLSVILVAFSGGLTEHARQVVHAAAVVLAVALLLGVISVAGAAGSQRPGTWFILEVAGLAIAATALIFTTAVTRSEAVRSLAPRYEDVGDDDEDFEDDPDLGEDD
jgi:hypothetical protein